MRRRDFMAGGLAAMASNAAPRMAWAQAAAASRLPARIIDVHCHIFNADDLPIEDFFKTVVLRDLLENLRKVNQTQLARLLERHPLVQEVVVELLASLLRQGVSSLRIGGAPSPREEIEEINALANASAQRLRQRADKRTSDEIAIMEAVLKEVWRPQVLAQRLRKSNESVALVREALLWVQYYIRKEAYPGRDEAFWNNAFDPTSGEVPQDDLAYVARALYNGSGPIGHYTRWALRYRRPRFDLADEIHAIHRQRTKLITPAMVDMSPWLNLNWNAEQDKDERRRLEGQVAGMRQIALRRNGPRVHGFMGFDPLRQAFYDLQKERGRAEGKSPLDIVKFAVEGRRADGAPEVLNGFVGVKLYPPMGFRAINNAALGAQFPAHVIDPSRGLGPDAGARIDEALKALYRWCRDVNVPIMAHANNTLGTAVGYGDRASPRHWRDLLRIGEFSSLRVNLAHFGGFEEAVQDGRPHTETWEWLVGDIWREMPQANIYADISFFDEVLPLRFTNDAAQVRQYEARKDQVRRLFTQFMSTFPSYANRLIYGSDWTLLGNAPGYPELRTPAPARFYADYVADFLWDLGQPVDAAQRREFMDKIFFRNAARFLGLDRAGQAGTNRARLEAFHRGAGMDVAWLDEFNL